MSRKSPSTFDCKKEKAEEWGPGFWWQFYFKIVYFFTPIFVSRNGWTSFYTIAALVQSRTLRVSCLSILDAASVVLVQPWPAILFVMRNLLNDECSNWKMYNDVTLSFFVRYVALDPSRWKRLTGYGNVLAAPTFFTTQNFLGKKKKRHVLQIQVFFFVHFASGSEVWNLAIHSLM